MTIGANRHTSGHFHKEWDVTVSGVLITLSDGSQSAINLNFHRANLIPSWRPYVGAVIGPANQNRENAKGIVAWKALLPDDAFYDWHTGQVL